MASQSVAADYGKCHWRTCTNLAIYLHGYCQRHLEEKAMEYSEEYFTDIHEGTCSVCGYVGHVTLHEMCAGCD